MPYHAIFLHEERFDDLVYPPSLKRRLAEELAGPLNVLRPGELLHPAVADELARTEIIFTTWSCPTFTPELLTRLPRLRAVFYAAGSVRTLVTPAFWERQIILCSAWRANAIPVAEFTLGAILLSLKNVWTYHARRPQCPEEMRSDLPMPGAYSSTVGLVSLGAIGRLVVELLRPFSIHVLAYDPYVSSEVAAQLGVEMVSLEELFARSDVVSLHVPWLPETEKMIARPLLERLKPSATLINTARGAIINEDDLVEVFTRRPDLTALLDVTYPEPPVAGSPLYKLPNIHLTPHIAGSVPKEWSRLGAYMVEEFSRFLRDEPLQHQVTPALLERMA